MTTGNHTDENLGWLPLVGAVAVGVGILWWWVPAATNPANPADAIQMDCPPCVDHNPAAANPFAAIVEDGPRGAKRPQELLVGKWTRRLPSGPDDVWSFGALQASGEGSMSRRVEFNGQAIPGESWIGRYRWRDNPLLGAADRTQLQIGYEDPVWGRQQFHVIVRQLTGTTLVLEGVFTGERFQFQRVAE